MFDVMADWLTVPLLNAEAGNTPARAGLRHPSIAPYGVFASADGQEILISIQNEREWQNFCHDVLQLPELVRDPRFANNVVRVNHRDETDGRVTKIFSGLSGDTLVSRLAKADIAFALLNDMAGLAAHPHLRRIEIAIGTKSVALPAPAAMFGDSARKYGAVPKLGEHTEAVLAEFGLAKT